MISTNPFGRAIGAERKQLQQCCVNPNKLTNSLNSRVNVQSLSKVECITPDGYTEITWYDFDTLPVFPLDDPVVADCTDGVLKFIALANTAVAAVAIQTSRGAFILFNSDFDTASTQLIFVDGEWKLLNNNIIFFPDPQFGPKLVGSPFTGNPLQGSSVAVSATGDTIAIGGPQDSNGIGAVWIFNFVNKSFIQINLKLVAINTITARNSSGSVANQGTSVALSLDGLTLAIGGPNDNSGIGAVWIFTFNGSRWVQQVKLVGTDAIGQSRQGQSVSLSANGTVLAVGGPGDNADIGAVWIFMKDANGIWLQQESKITNNTVGQAKLGTSVTLAANGKILVTGGPNDNGGKGAVFIYLFSINGFQFIQKIIAPTTVDANQGTSVAASTDGSLIVFGAPFDTVTSIRSGSTFVYKLQSTALSWALVQKLVGANSSGEAAQGTSVAVSADGTTIATGGPFNSASTGATWVFSKLISAPTYIQRAKVIGFGSIGGSLQGSAVALNADGNLLAVGGPGDNTNIGATWLFV